MQVCLELCNRMIVTCRVVVAGCGPRFGRRRLGLPWGNVMPLRANSRGVSPALLRCPWLFCVLGGAALLPLVRLLPNPQTRSTQFDFQTQKSRLRFQTSSSFAFSSVLPSLSAILSSIGRTSVPPHSPNTTCPRQFTPCSVQDHWCRNDVSSIYRFVH